MSGIRLKYRGLPFDELEFHPGRGIAILLIDLCYVSLERQALVLLSDSGPLRTRTIVQWRNLPTCWPLCRIWKVAH